MTSDAYLTASCLCQSIIVRLPEKVNWVAHCHCSLCQKAHGAAFVTWVGVPLKQFSVEKGNEKLQWYRSTEKGKRAHCQQCGTPMLFCSERWPDEMHIARALIDQDLLHPVQCHAFYDARVDWTLCDPELPKRGGTSGTQPINN